MAGGEVRSRAFRARERASPMVSEMVGSVQKWSTSPVRVTDQTYNPAATVPDARRSPLTAADHRRRRGRLGWRRAGRWVAPRRLGGVKSLEVPGLGSVSRVGLGAWQFGSTEWGYGQGYAQTTARAIVDRALKLGVSLFDTAEIYGTGNSERILGSALGAARGRVVVASKLFPIAPFPPIIRRRAAGSARRLQLERIGLYQAHWPNPLVPDSVIMPGFRSLLEDGRIAAVGVSNYSLRRWHRADAALGRPVV